MKQLIQTGVPSLHPIVLYQTLRGCVMVVVAVGGGAFMTPRGGGPLVQ